MVIRMNKTMFLKKLMETFNVDQDKANIINNVFECNNIISKKSKDKIINDLIGQLNIDAMEANDIYDKVMSIITTSIKEKIKHPFRSQD